MDRDPSEVRQDIETTRAEFGDTLEALAYKTDVGARLNDAVTDRVEGVKETVRSWGDAVTGAASNMQSGIAESASQTAAQVSNSASQTAARVSHSVSNGAENVRSALGENPLGLMGGAFALGLLTGLIAPITPTERRSIGPIRDALVDRASDVADDLVEHGKHVVQETAQAAVQTAMTSARQHGQEVLETAQRGGPSPGA